MIRHIVLYWLKDPALIGPTTKILNSMKDKIPGLLRIEAVADSLHSERSCDLCLHTVFESKEALAAYRTHPVHLPVQKHMHSVITRSASADFEVDEI